jgi:hypothetical protein
MKGHERRGFPRNSGCSARHATHVTPRIAQPFTRPIEGPLHTQNTRERIGRPIDGTLSSVRQLGRVTFVELDQSMPCDVKLSASHVVKSHPSRRTTLSAFVPPQLSQPVEKPPSGSLVASVRGEIPIVSRG